MARLAATALVVVGAATMSATSAQAASTGQIIHDQSHLCLDGSISQGVRLNTCNSSSRYQQWTVNGYYLKHVQSGLCLDGSVSQGVRLNKESPTTYQEWALPN